MIQFTWRAFQDLALQELYALLKLRAEVFVVEQKCPYLDLDGLDPSAMHLLGQEGDTLVAYIRLFPPVLPEKVVIFGRVATSRSARTQGFGKQLMQEMLAYSAKHYPDSSIRCSAQHYLVKFYESFGFKTVGDIYAEDGIPHIEMRK